MNTTREGLERKIADAEARELALRSGDTMNGFDLDDDAEDEGGLARNVSEAGEAVVDFVKRHPLAVIGGVIAVGAIASLLIPNSPTRRVSIAAGNKAAKKASAFNAIAAQFALTFGAHMLEAFQEARDTGKGKLSDASEAAGHAAESAKRSARDAGKKLAKMVRH